MSLCTKNPPPCVYIQSLDDRRKYKLVFRGDICLLGTERIKEYIEKSIGVPVAQQKLTFNGQEIADGLSGDTIGLYNNAILQFQRASSSLRDLPANRDCQRTTSLAKSASRRDSTSISPITPLHSSCSLMTITTKVVPRRPEVSEGAAEYPPLPKLEWGAKLGSYLDPYLDSLGASHQPRGRPYTGRSFLESFLPTQLTTDRSLFRPASGSSNQDNATETMRGVSTAKVTLETVGGKERPNGNLLRYETSEDEASLLEEDRHGKWQSTPNERESIESSVVSSRTLHANQGQQETLSRRADSHRRSSLLTDRCLPALRAENQALTRENELLQEKLLEAERRAANATSNWQLQEEVLALKAALEAAEKNKQRAVDEAQTMWLHKEAELIAELDFLRKERDQVCAIKENFKNEQQGQITSLQSQLRSQRDEIHAKEETIRQLHFTLAELQSKQDPREVSPVQEKSIDEFVRGSLERISKVLETPKIKLDEKGTCIINISDEISILITLDSESERLHMYTILLNELPASEAVCLRLYENLLEGALLGRNTAGGTIGISKEEGVVLLSIPVDVRYSDENALAHLVFPFVELVRRWKKGIQKLLSMP
ncbi:unnamed protein product [Phytomonas sp. Hart1]|nr:unnamed protein product [Phytomonas sp. Hart1]|eukprot:CCW66477.1 unnamed protein product [Phytomonas sp. isolate Hart1]